MYKVTALMPMKDYSERVPDKNISVFCGKPLYTWVLDSLLSSAYITQIIINTDSQRIKDDISERYYGNKKIQVLDRPDYLLGNDVSATELIKHDTDYSDNEDILQTHATNPLLQTVTIDKAIECYFNNKPGYDSLLTVLRHNHRFYFPDGRPVNHEINVMRKSQDEQIVYEENSNIFLFSKAIFISNNNRIGKKPYFYEMSRMESTDIDEPEDFIFAQMLMEYKERQSRGI